MCIFISSLVVYMQNLLLYCKKIFIIFLLLTLIMLVGAESIGIVAELGFTALQHI